MTTYYTYIIIYPNIYLRAWFVYQRMASVSFMGFPKISAGCFTLRWRGGFGHRDSQVPKASWLDMSLGPFFFLNSTCHFLEKKTIASLQLRSPDLLKDSGYQAFHKVWEAMLGKSCRVSSILSCSRNLGSCLKVVAQPPTPSHWVENHMFFFCHKWEASPPFLELHPEAATCTSRPLVDESSPVRSQGMV